MGWELRQPTPELFGRFSRNQLLSPINYKVTLAGINVTAGEFLFQAS